MIARLILISVLGALLPVAPLFAPSAMAASPASEAVTDAKDAAAFEQAFSAIAARGDLLFDGAPSGGSSVAGSSS